MKQFIQSSRQKRRVLVVDDEFINRALLGAMLDPVYDVSYAENGSEALRLLEDDESSFSLVLLDLLMPVTDGFEVLSRCKSSPRLKSLPIIVMTSEKSAEVKSIRMGAADFIPKPYDMPDVILARCERIIEMSEDKSIIRFTEKDALTGLYTKEYFLEYIRRLTPNMEKDADALVLNIDRFSLLNELFGREEGNRVLKKTADLISDILIKSRGIACRTEGDSFWVFREREDDYEAMVAEICAQLSDFAPTHSVHISAGVYRPDDRLADPESAFSRAKAACGRIHGHYGVYTAVYNRELHEREMYCERLIGDIQEAIYNKHLTVFFQPKFNISGDKPRLCSAEALVRWKHPKLGMISPGVFIPLFEQNGLIRKVDGFVWREAAAQIKRWKDKFGCIVPVSVNVSRIDIFDPSLVETLTGITGEFGLSPSDLKLEITESAYAEDSKQLIAVIENLRSKGFAIEMDDFGSGYSSLNMLTSLPFDVLKMDMKFIRSMFENEKSLRMVELVIDIARFLDVPVVAEGVEEERQLETLKKMGCDIIQGYYFSPPVPAEEFERFIAREI